MSPLAKVFVHQLEWAIASLLVFFGVGRLFLRRLRFHSAIEEWSFGIVLGMAVSIGLVALLAVLGLAYPVAFLILGVGVYGFRGFRPSGRDVVVAVLLFVLASPAIFLTLYPAATWDDISDHLPIAGSILLNHRLLFDPFLTLPLVPLNAEMLFAIGLPISVRVAQLMSWLTFYALGLACFAMAERQESRASGFLAYGLLLSSQLMMRLGTICYVDVPLSLFVAAGVFALANYLKDEQHGWLVLSAVFLGVAAGIKYTALVFCALSLLALLVTKNRKALPQYAGLMMLIGCPWYVRNLWYSGNPVWPFMGELFGYSAIWELRDYSGILGDLSAHMPTKTLGSFLAIPLVLFNETQEGKLMTVNPLIWCGLLPLSFVRADRSVRYLQLASLSFLLFWFLSINVVRYFLPDVALLCVLGAIGLTHAQRHLASKAQITATLAAVSIIPALWFFVQQIGQRGAPPVGRQQWEGYLEQCLPAYRATRAAVASQVRTYALYNEDLYFYGEQRLFGNWFGTSRYSDVVEHAKNVDSLFGHLSELQAGGLLLNKDRIKGMKEIPAEAVKVFEHLQDDQRFSKVYEDPHAVFFRLVETANAAPSPTTVSSPDSGPLARDQRAAR